MQQKKLPWTSLLFLTISFLFYGMGGLAEAAGKLAGPDQWVLGNRLLVGALFLIVFGFVTGAYALLLSGIGPLIKRVFLYPLFKFTGANGDKKPLITKK